MPEDLHIPTIDELLELPQPDDAQISPDGRYIIYTVRTPHWGENRYIVQIWLVATDGQREPRQLTYAPKAASHTPRWSPDSQWIAFISKRSDDKANQIYRLSPFGGEAERLTDLETDVEDIVWSPDGQAIAYITEDKESEADKERQERYGEYRVEDEDHHYAHLWLLSLPNDRKSRKLTKGKDFHVLEFDWSPDGRRIAFCASATPDMPDQIEAKIYIVDLESLIVTAVSGQGCRSPQWSPDGSRLAFTRNDKPDNYFSNNEICTVASTGEDLCVVPLDFDEITYLLDWGPDGMYFEAMQRTSDHIFRLNPDTSQISCLTPSQSHWASYDASFSADFSQLSLIASDADHYDEVMVIDLRDGCFTRLTNFTQKLAGWQIGRSELYQWTSSDGTPIEGVLTKPVNFDPNQQYPLLVVIHGGPTGVDQPILLAHHNQRHYPFQLWVANGAIILRPNYRGSAGYGETFRSLNVRNLGLGDYADVISGVEALITEGWVDPEKMGAMGWSQGGYISAFITTYSDRFKAVSVGAGISNWMTYYVNTDVHPFTRQYLQATPWDDSDIYTQTSPMTYIKQAQTPTLIQHGTQDTRVPLPNAYELYQGLRDVGVEVKLVTYPGMAHGPTRPRQRRQIMQDNYDWFNRFIFGEMVDIVIKRPLYLALASEEKAQHDDVRQWARVDDAEFRLFSHQHGVCETADEEPEMTAEQVAPLAHKLAEQLQALEVEEITLYTEEVEKRPSGLIALGCLQIAAGIVGNIIIKHEEF
jgi:dipeptidyl aminopeptidase/acylaminoacyl peptidase